MSDVTLKMKMSPTAAGKLFQKSCRLEDENARLQSEVERLRGRCGMLEEAAAFTQMIAERQLDPDFVMPGVESDMKLLLQRVRPLTKADLAEDYENPWLLIKQAEAVDEVNLKLTKLSKDTSGLMDSKLVSQYCASVASEEAQRLRQQAAESAGGEDAL